MYDLVLCNISAAPIVSIGLVSEKLKRQNYPSDPLWATTKTLIRRFECRFKAILKTKKKNLFPCGVQPRMFLVGFCRVCAVCRTLETDRRLRVLR